MSAVAAPMPDTASRGRCACGKPIVKAGMCEDCAREARLQRSAIDARDGGVAPSSVHAVLGGAGEPLPRSVRASMEPLFGRDFSSVRVHTGPDAEQSAAAVGADAYTVGSSVVFGRDRYRPALPRGRALLAHELAHVVQQDGARRPGAAIDVQPAYTPLEGEADRAAARAARGAPAGSITRGAPAAVQRGQAGNCVVPALSDNVVGEEVHKVIQGWCGSQYAPCRGEEPIPGTGPGGGVGRADLFYEAPKSPETEIGEIKPISQAGQVDPHGQLENYIQGYKKLHPTQDVKRMYGWTPAVPPNGMYPFYPPPNGDQWLNCSAPTNGVYFYWCTKSKKDKDYKPKPIEIDDELWEKIRERIKNIRDKWKQPPVQPPIPIPDQPQVPDQPGDRPQPDKPVPPPIPIPDKPTVPDRPPVPDKPTVPDRPTVPDKPNGTPQPDKPNGKPTPEKPRPRPPARPPQPQPQAFQIPDWVWITLLVICAIALAILLLPEEIVAGIVAGLVWLGRLIIGAAPALGALFAGRPAFAAEGGGGTGGTGGTAGTGGTPGGQGGKGAPVTGDPAGTSVDTAIGQIQAATDQPSPATSQAAANQAAQGAKQITGAAASGKPATDPRAAEMRQAAKDAAPQADAAAKATAPGGAPGTGATGPRAADPAPAPEADVVAGDPPSGSKTQFPITILSGLSADTPVGSEVVATVRMEVAQPFTVDVHFRVTSKAGGTFKLLVTQGWYSKSHNLGTAAGTTYTYSFGRQR